MRGVNGVLLAVTVLGYGVRTRWVSLKILLGWMMDGLFPSPVFSFA